MGCIISAVRGELVAVDDTTGIQSVQVLGLDRELLDVQRLQGFGYSSVPPVGTEVLVLFINGRAHGYVVADDDPASRVKGLNPGDSVAYSVSGARAICRATGAIELTPALSQPVLITGNLVVTGNVSDVNGSMQEMRGFYNAHTHGGPPAVPLMT